MTDDDQPVPRAGGPIRRAPVDVAAGHRDAAGDLLLDQLEVRVLHQPGGDAVLSQGLQLGARVGGVAVALHHRQVVVVAVGALERAGLEGLQEHGAGGKAGVIPLAPLGGVPLPEVGHPHQGVGIGAVAGTGGAAAAPPAASAGAVLHSRQSGPPSTSASGSWSTRRSSAACSQARCRSSSGSK